MKKSILAIALVAAVPAMAEQSASPERQAAVAARGAQVMPFDLAATQHIFTRTADGGVQRVVARNPADARQVELVRAHLRDIAGKFARGDFSDPAQIHGAAMPGLAQLQAAPGSVKVSYKDVDGGADVSYASADPALVKALHDWFDAQVADHGKDAMAGHHHHH